MVIKSAEATSLSPSASASEEGETGGAARFKFAECLEGPGLELGGLTGEEDLTNEEPAA